MSRRGGPPRPARARRFRDHVGTDSVRSNLPPLYVPVSPSPVSLYVQQYLLKISGQQLVAVLVVCFCLPLRYDYYCCCCCCSSRLLKVTTAVSFLFCLMKAGLIISAIRVMDKPGEPDARSNNFCVGCILEGFMMAFFARAVAPLLHHATSTTMHYGMYGRFFLTLYMQHQFADEDGVASRDAHWHYRRGARGTHRC